MTAKYRIFIWTCIGIFLINLLVMNDLTTVWSGAEATSIVDAQTDIDTQSPFVNVALAPSWKLSSIYKLFGFNLFLLRLPGVMLLILGLLGFYIMGKKVFGRAAAALTVLILASSLLIVNLAKFASSDIWLFVVQLISFVSLILYLKQPIAKWKFAFWITLVLGALIHPVSMLVWSLGLWGYFLWRHPKGANIKGLYPWLIWVIIFPILYFVNGWNISIDSFYTTYAVQNYGQYILWLLLGMLPWIGFLPAAFVDLYRKGKKKEELSIIIGGWLLVGLLSQSIVVEAALAFMIAKQVLAYFDKNYPNDNLVKSFSMLNLVFAFCVMTVLMLSGHELFKDIGYRSAVSITIVSWMPALIGVIGLFARSRSMIITGMTMSGLLFTMFFWLQLNPLIEHERGVVKRVIEETLKKSGDATVYLTAVPNNFDVYLNSQSANGKRLFRDEDITSLINTKKAIVITNGESYKALQTKLKQGKPIKLSGSPDWWINRQDFYILGLD